MRIDRDKVLMKQKKAEDKRRDSAQNLKGQVYFEAEEKQLKDQGRGSYIDTEHNYGVFLVIISKCIKKKKKGRSRGRAREEGKPIQIKVNQLLLA